MWGISASSSAGPPDLTVLFRLAAHEAKESRAQGRILRVVSVFMATVNITQLHL